MRHFLAFFVLIAAGCASTEMKGYVGKPIEEAMIAYGQPENIIEFPDGRRAYQFRWGGGTFVQPGHGHATVTSAGNVAVINTQSTPAAIINNPGCLITFITNDAGTGYVVTDYRVPKQLVC